MATKLQIRRGTYTQWIGSSEILADGELVWDITNNKFKVGTGALMWKDLPYVGTTSTGAPSLELSNTFTNTNTFNVGLTANITSTTKGLVVKAPLSGTGANAFEIQDKDNSPVFAIDYTGVVLPTSSTKSALVVADSGIANSSVSITAISAAQNLITFTTTGGYLRNNSLITFSGFSSITTPLYTFLNNQSFLSIYSGTGNSFSIAYPLSSVTVDSATSVGVYSTLKYTSVLPIPFTVGQLVTISGCSNSSFNTTAVITAVNANDFSIANPTNIDGVSTGGAAIQALPSYSVSGSTVYGFAQTLGQQVSVQRWQVLGDSDVSGVDPSGFLYSKKIYTRDLTTLTGNALTSAMNSQADLVARSIGIYDTAGTNQIFGPTTIGNNSGNAISTQYGFLQVFRATPTASDTNSVLAVRAGGGTGRLQTWLQASTSVANMNYQGLLTLGATGTSTGGINSNGGITINTGNLSLSNGNATITGNLTAGSKSSFIVTSGGFDYSGNTAINGLFTVTAGLAKLTNLEVDSFAPVTAMTGSSSSWTITGGYDLSVSPISSISIKLNSSNVGTLPPLNSKIRVYTTTSTGTINDDDWAEGYISSVTHTPGAGVSEITLTGKGPKAGLLYSSGDAIHYLKVVPISAYTDSEIRTLDHIRVGAEGTKLKRKWTGSSSVTFTGGSGTLNYGQTLPVTPSSVSVIAVSSTAVTLTLSTNPTTTTIPLKGWTGASAVADGSYTIYWTAIE